MDLKCYVNGKEYKDKMVQGIVVSEEYNETLDSATVILSQVPKIKDLRPYDDFYIYEGEFKGYNRDKEFFYNVNIENYKAIIKISKMQNEEKKIGIVCENLNNFKFFDINIIFYDTSVPTDPVEVEDQYELIEYHGTENYVFLLRPKRKNFLPSIYFNKTDNDVEINGVLDLKNIYIDDETERQYKFSNLAFKDFNLVIADEYGIEENFSTFKVVKYGYDSNENFDWYDEPMKSDTYFKAYVPNKKFKEKSEVVVLFNKISFFKSNGGLWNKGGSIQIKARYRFRHIDNLTFALDPYDGSLPKITGKKQKESDTFFLCSTYSSKQAPDDNDLIFVSCDFIQFEKFYIFLEEEKERYKFYRHFLVDQYVEEMLNVDEDPNKILYKYKIELFSETKKLETIQIPNFSVTQPQHGGEKKSIYSYIVDVVEMYNPVYKMCIDEQKKLWVYNKKYAVDESLKDIFENMYCPDFTLNNPNLRDVLAQLMLVADRIPYVEDDVIKAMDITAIKAPFEMELGEITNIVSSRTSSNHCDNLKRTYSNALSQDNSAHTVEYIGFRNSSSAMLTLENLKLETRFPIYKINKMYMCYYKKAKIVSKLTYTTGTIYSFGEKVTYNNEMYKCIAENGSSETFVSSEWKKITKSKVFLCKQDITKLILLNSERNLISQDWTEFLKEDQAFNSINDMAKYKFCTLAYNIGSNEINGFGEKMQYFESPYWDQTATYIQNVLVNIDRIRPYGIYDQDFFGSVLEDDEQIYVSIETNFNDYYDFFKNIIISPFSNAALSFKSLVFQVDYNAFYNGTIYHSKDTDRDDIVINDNSSSSLTLLEQDGIHQKEKANRFGNKTLQISARYKDVNDLQELGSVFNYADEKNVIIYHKQYSIFDNIITCSYSGSHDYVLKNYFTSVYAKHRPYNLMSYNESVRRSENRKMYLVISKDKAYVENENKKYSMSNFKHESFAQSILSFFKPDELGKTIGDFKKRDKINYGLISYDGKYYLSDVHSFSSGNSICFNISMYDNVSAGLYLDKNQLEPNMKWSVSSGLVENSEEEIYLRGTVQRWYLTTDDVKEGHAETMGFFVGHKDEEYAQELYDDQNYVIDSIIKDRFFRYPLVYSTDIDDLSGVIGNEYLINKDNKEIIDMTFQTEFVADNFFFSNWMLKLSDIITSYNKYSKNIYTSDFPNHKHANEFLSFSVGVNGNIYVTAANKKTVQKAYAPVVILSIDNAIGIKEGDVLNKDVYSTVGSISPASASDPNITGYKLKLLNVTDVSDDFVSVLAVQTIEKRDILDANPVTYVNDDLTIKFKKINNFGITAVPDGKTWYCNYDITSEDVPDTFWEKLWESIVGLLPDNLDSNNATLADGTTEIPMGSETISIADIIAYSDYIIEDPYRQLISKYNTRNGIIKQTETSNVLVYRKNLYLATSDETIDNKSIYTQFIYNGNEQKISDDITVDNMRTPQSILKVRNNGHNLEQLIVTIPQEYIDKNVKSIQVWYLDNDDQRYVKNDVFHFVWGINLDYDELLQQEPDSDGNRYVKYNISVLSTRDLRVFDENHIEIGKVKNIANSSDFETEQTYEKNEEQQ